MALFRRRKAFHDSDSTSSDGSSSGGDSDDDERRFQRRKAKSMAKQRSRYLEFRLRFVRGNYNSGILCKKKKKKKKKTSYFHAECSAFSFSLEQKIREIRLFSWWKCDRFPTHNCPCQTSSI